MPRGDHTGPMGMGPKTGRGAGYCNGFDAPGYVTQPGFGSRSGGGFGRGRGQGRSYGCGQGRGFRQSFVPVGTPGRGRATAPGAAAFDEKTALRQQAEVLETRLRQIQQQLADTSPETE